MHPPATTTLQRTIGAFLLVLSMLFAQFAGQQHRIEHAQWQGASAELQLQSGSDQPASGHSCLVFDAATLADMLGAAILISFAIAARYARALRIAEAGWRARFTALFLSRAPPFSSSSL